MQNTIHVLRGHVTAPICAGNVKSADLVNFPSLVTAISRQNRTGRSATRVACAGSPQLALMLLTSGAAWRAGVFVRRHARQVAEDVVPVHYAIDVKPDMRA